MAESKTKQTEQTAPAKPARVFELVQVVQANPAGGVSHPGGPAAAVLAALDAGLRPTGAAKLSGPTLHADGESQVWTWSVPVEPNQAG